MQSILHIYALHFHCSDQTVQQLIFDFVMQYLNLYYLGSTPYFRIQPLYVKFLVVKITDFYSSVNFQFYNKPKLFI